MKKNFGLILKTTIPLALGFFLVWWMFKDMTETDKEDLVFALKKANYLWIGLSLVFAVFSHLSRAYRWKYTLKPLGYEPKFLNSFFTVMIGYAANLLIPRMGEVSRCAYLSKYSDIPFNKVFGTVIAERVADSIILVIMIVLVIYLQFDVIGKFMLSLPIAQKIANPWFLLIAGVVAVLGAYVAYKLLMRSSLPLVQKIRTFISGILEGVYSIVKMEDKWSFLFHTFFIWAMYIAMFYVAFYSMEGVKSVPLGGVVSAFVVGGLSIVATNGGLGAYPLGIMGILTLYGIDETTGKAFGWVIWGSQTIMIIIMGLLSVVFINLYNKSENAPSGSN